MRTQIGGRVAIVDYGLGNLFSVARACEHAGLTAVTTSDPRVLDEVDAIILPGVGAFGAAMAALGRLDLISALRQHARGGTPIVGVCLGLQLLMTESEEFGSHRGLGLIDGRVIRLEGGAPAAGRRFKVPQVGWNRIQPTGGQSWDRSLLSGEAPGTYMYFVHSFHAVPAEAGVVLSTSAYEGIEFCSSVAHGRVFGCQFHPERSGPQGLRIYDNLAHLIRRRAAVGVAGGL